mgnify:CR=1 FL=1
MNTKKLPLAFWIFVGLVVGIVAGLALMAIPGGVDFAKTYVKPFGTIFLNLIKFIVVPIVLFSITAGIISMGDIKKLGSVGVKTIVYYMCTTAGAVIIALVLANLCKGFFPPLDKLSSGEYTAGDPVSFMDTLVNIFPANIIEPMRSASMLQVIVIAILFGVGILIAGEKGLVCAQVVDSFNEVSMKVMDLIIRLSPVGVACLLAPVVAENGPKILGALAAVLLVAYIGYVIHALAVYSFSMAALARISPVTFFREMVPAMMMAFSSASSVGTLPFTLECAEKLGARKEIASFVIPLGATINMDGTAIYQCVATIFLATCCGMTLTLGQMVTIVVTATLASIGTAGTPGAGMIMLAMVLEAMNIPVDMIMIIYGIDRLFDMGRTCLNITGDISCACCVTKWESKKAAQTAK